MQIAKRQWRSGTGQRGKIVKNKKVQKTLAKVQAGLGKNPVSKKKKKVGHKGSINRHSRGTVRVRGKKIQESKNRQRWVHRQVGRTQAAAQWAWLDSHGWTETGLATEQRYPKSSGKNHSQKKKTGLDQKVEKAKKQQYVNESPRNRRDNLVKTVSPGVVYSWRGE